MGKKSLLSSTSKKKGDNETGGEPEKNSAPAVDSAKKITPKPARKKAAPKTAAKKKTAPKARAKKKAAAKKKMAPQKKPAAGGTTRAKSSATAKAVKAPAAKKKPVSLRDLLFKKFDTPAPERLYTPPSDVGRSAAASSPPFTAGAAPGETDRIRGLLFKKFDLPETETNVADEPDSKETPEKPLAEIEEETTRMSGTTEEGKDENHGPSLENDDSDAGVKAMDPMLKAAALGILVLVVLVVLICSASDSNSSKFYLKPVDGELEIWKGNYSPRGIKKLVTLSAAFIPEQLKDIYTQEEAYTLIFDSYISRADELLDKSDVPDFEMIRRTLNKALPFAILPELDDTLQRRLAKIDMVALVYKAYVLADRNTAEDLAAARSALETAMQLRLDGAEKELVSQKLGWVTEQQARLADAAAMEVDAAEQAVTPE